MHAHRYTAAAIASRSASVPHKRSKRQREIGVGIGNGIKILMQRGTSTTLEIVCRLELMQNLQKAIGTSAASLLLSYRLRSSFADDSSDASIRTPRFKIENSPRDSRGGCLHASGRALSGGQSYTRKKLERFSGREKHFGDGSASV